MTLIIGLSPLQGHTETISAITGAKSQHYIKGQDNSLFNADHHMKGLIFNNKIVVATFENSYYNRSHLIGYNWKLTKYQLNTVQVSTNLMLGAVTGYTKDQAGAAYLNKHLSLYILPSIAVKYPLTEKVSFTVDLGVLPSDNGAVMVQNIRFNYRY